MAGLHARRIDAGTIPGAAFVTLHGDGTWVTLAVNHPHGYAKLDLAPLQLAQLIEALETIQKEAENDAR